MTFKEKLQNYWYYYKVHTLVGLACALIFAVLISQCASNETYDYSVTLYMAKPIPESVREVMAEELAKFGTDQNGDGEVTVEILDCSYGDNDNIRMNQIAKMQARLTMPESVLFLTDETCYRSLDEMDLFDTLEILPDKDGRAMNIGASPMTTAITREVGAYMPNEFFISKRRVAGTAIEEKEGAAEFEKASAEMLEELCKAYGE